MKISTETGILLDRTYTVKAVQEMLNQMQTNPGRFQGKRVLFIHTGGLFMIFDGEINDPVRNYAKTNQIFKLDNLSWKKQLTTIDIWQMEKNLTTTNYRLNSPHTIFSSFFWINFKRFPLQNKVTAVYVV